MKKSMISVLLVLCLMLCASLSLSSCENGVGDGGNILPTAEKLSAPVVTLNGNTASWDADGNADRFEISVDGSLSFIENTVTSKTLTEGQTFKIRAIGNAVNYTTSDWSNVVTYTSSPSNPAAEKLSAPVVTLDGALASWSAVANAEKYEISISGTLSYLENTVTSKTLANGQSFKIRAVGDGTSYTTSDWSNTVTYTDGTTPPPTPSATKLSAPTVTLNGTVASWSAVANAERYEISVSGSISYLENTVTSTTLTNGQSFKIRAVGDGTNYTTSDWSNTVTYTEGTTPPPVPGNAPTYLGILASNSVPSASEGLPETLPSRASGVVSVSSLVYRSLEESLAEYFASSSNYLGISYPEESDYDVYSTAGSTVYVQIWLNNPEQYTILSLMLNGTKYQVGGGLSSFFIEENGQHYNCVYVAVQIPENTYVEKAYTVTNIEYISNTFINADGTDQFMNDNDTITVGLPYNAEMPSVGEYTQNGLTYNSYSAGFNLSNKTLSELAGGWMGAAVFDEYNNIISNQALNAGENTIEVSGLAESTHYLIKVYIYADLHDGRGVTAHLVHSEYLFTESVIENFTAEAGFYQHWGFEELEEEADSGLSVTVRAGLKSPTARITRVELYKGNDLVQTMSDFYYSTTFEDLLARTSYTVRIYYSDNEYTEHYSETYAYTESLNAPTMEIEEANPFLNAAAIVFTSFENGYLRQAIAKNVSVRVFNNTDEARYADYILELCDNPNLIEELEALAGDYRENGDYNAEGMIYRRIQILNMAKNVMLRDGNADLGTDRAQWEALLSQYTATYTFDDADLFKTDFNAYLIVRNFFGMFGDGCNYEIYADVNFKDGKGFVRTELNSGDINLNSIGSSESPLHFDIAIDGYKVIVNPYINYDSENKSEMAIVSYKIELYNSRDVWGDEPVDVLYTSSEVDFGTLNEEAWIEAYVAAMKGEAILPSTEEAIIESLGWRAIFEIINGLDIEAENDYEGGSGDGSTSDGEIIVDGNGNVIVGGGTSAGTSGEQIIGNLAERQFLRDILAYDYVESYEYRLKDQMLEDFRYDRYYYDLTDGLDSIDDKLDALIGGALNSTVVSVFDSTASSIYHYLSWHGAPTDEIFVGFVALMEAYIEDNSLVSSVNWAESYRRIMSFEDFDTFYPFGTFETTYLEIDHTAYPAGSYKIVIRYRFADFDEEREDERDITYDSIKIMGQMNAPTVRIDRNYVSELHTDVQDFWDFHYEIEILDSVGGTVYSGNWDSFDSWSTNLGKGYKVRARAVVNDYVDTFWEDSEWCEWVEFLGIKVQTPIFNEYNSDNCSIEWYTDSGPNSGESHIDHYVYTINGGFRVTVAKDGNLSVRLENGDVLRVKSVAVAGGDYIDSDWAEFTCTDSRITLPTPENVAFVYREEQKMYYLEWTLSSNEGVSYCRIYINGMENAGSGVGYDAELGVWFAQMYKLTPGAEYKVQAITEDTENYRNGAVSEPIIPEITLQDPTFSSASSSQIRWSSVMYATSYWYKIGENGTEIQANESNPTRTRLDISSLNLQPGDEIWLQARAEGCTSSNWVLLWSNSV